MFVANSAELTPLTQETWGLRPEPKRQPEGDFYKWVLTPGRPLELFRRPMTCFDRTWTLHTWGRKLLVTPRELHCALVEGMKAGKTIREVVLSLNPDLPQLLARPQGRRTSDTND
jgi:hypothetical protein